MMIIAADDGGYYTDYCCSYLYNQYDEKMPILHFIILLCWSSTLTVGIQSRDAIFVQEEMGVP